MPMKKGVKYLIIITSFVLIATLYGATTINAQNSNAYSTTPDIISTDDSLSELMETPAPDPVTIISYKKDITIPLNGKLTNNDFDVVLSDPSVKFLTQLSDPNDYDPFFAAGEFYIGIDVL